MKVRLFLFFTALFMAFSFSAEAQNTEPKTNQTENRQSQAQTERKPEVPPSLFDEPITEVEERPAAPTFRPYTGPRVRQKSKGFRIQVYSGAGNTESKLAAKEMEAKIRTAFPELSCYTRFKTPRWVCRVGDFRSRHEAQAYLDKIRKKRISSVASIVSDEVLLPRNW